MKADGSDPHVVEPLHYQTTIDGSRAPVLTAAVRSGNIKAILGGPFR